MAWGLATIVLASGCASESPHPTEHSSESAADDPIAIEAERLRDLALDRWIERSVELQRVNQRLRLAGRSLCRRSNVPVLGVAVQVPSAVPLELQPSARRRFGDGNDLVVLAVFSEAESAGRALAVGDRLLRIDGHRISELDDLNRETKQSVQLQIWRNDSRHTLDVEVSRGCGFPAELISSEQVGAYTNGEVVVFTTAFLREMEDVDILAAVVGHELAHNIEGGLARGDVRPIHREARADHLGLYLAAMAGYRVSTDSPVYIKLKRNINTLTERSQSHPVTSSRVAAMRKTLAEIEQRQSAGLPLIPDP